MHTGVLYPPTNQLVTDQTIGIVKLRKWVPDSWSLEINYNDSSTPQSDNSVSSGRHSKPPQRVSLARQRSRRYQARYRQRQLEMKNDLENDVQNLQKEIKELEYRQLCESTVITASNVWSVVLEYFRIFRHGFKESSFEWNASAFVFLQKAMATDVSDGYLNGPKALMQNWELFSSYFDDIHVELKSMTNTKDGSILATTSTTFTISSKTLRLAFPHLNSDEHGGMYGGTWSTLAKRMEGQRLVMRGSVRFFWDSVTERVVRILTWSDMLTPFCRVLGNLDDVSHVFDRALVTLDCRLLLMTPC